MSDKKGNIDTNLVFNMMKKYIEDDFDKAILVSSDGDYKMMVDYFLDKDKFLKILIPNIKFVSSLYKKDKRLREGFLVRLGDSKDKRLCCTNLPPNHKKNTIGYFLFIFTSKFLKIY